MDAISATLCPGDRGARVANLQAALLLLLGHGAWKSFDPPDHPSPEELKELGLSLRREQADQTFGAATSRLLLYFQMQQGLGDQFRGVVEAATAQRLNALLAACAVRSGPAESVVIGTVTGSDGKPLRGLQVVAFDRDLRRHQRLGDAATDANGRYEIHYRPGRFRRAEASVPLAADLFVQLSSDGGRTPLATSEVRYNAGWVETIDLAAPVSADGPTEFERVAEQAGPLLVGQGAPHGAGKAEEARPTDLRPDELNAEDIAFIARDTGLDATAVQAWAASARWRKDALGLLGEDADPGLAAVVGSAGWPFFHAVLREQLAADLDGILARGEAVWQSQQSGGEALRRIPVIDADQRKQLMHVLQVLARLVCIDWRRPSPGPLARVLAGAPLPRPVALQALEIFGQQGLEQADAYAILAEQFPDQADGIGRFIQALRLRTLAGGDARFAKTIRAALGDVPDPLPVLAGWSLAHWRTIAIAAGNEAGPPEPEAAHSRAVGLQLQVEQALPLPALMQRLRDIGPGLRHPVLGKLLPLLATHGEHARSLLGGRPDSRLPADPMPPEAAAIVRNLGRYLGTGVPLQGGIALIDGGMDSPAAASRFGTQVLQQVLGGLYPQQLISGIAEQLQRSANAANGLMFSLVSDWRLGSWFASLGDASAPPQIPAVAPGLRELFGELDDCACLPCESMLSPGAYLVDLLNLLKTVPGTGGAGLPLQTAQSALRARRPDIFRLDLGCAAAETEVLHIDLAITVMQDALGTAPTAQLAAAPFPWTLPFDRGFAELRPTAERLGLSRTTLLALTDAAPAADVAAATLAIAQTQDGQPLSEWTLITTPRSGADLAEVWGLPRSAGISLTDPDSGATVSGTLSTVLGRASVLLDRMGLEPDQLDAVLASRYVGGLALSQRQQCKASAMLLAGQPEAVFDRLHRFTRLARKLSAWSVPLLDSALQACQLPDTGRQPSDYVAALQTLAAAERARLDLQLAPELVLAMRMPPGDIRLRSAADATLFARDFGPLAGSIGGADSLSQRLDLVAGALGCDSRELATVIAATAMPAPDQVGSAFTVANLTWLYRHVHLARALQLTVAQLLQLKLVSGIDPFEAPSAGLTPQAGFERLSALRQAALQIAASPWPPALVADVLVPAPLFDPWANRPAGLGLAQALEPAQLTSELVALQAVLRLASGAVEAARSAAQLERLLQAWIGNDAAARVTTALVAASAPAAAEQLGALPDAAAVDVLSAPTLPAYAPGNRTPLMDATAARALLTPNAAAADVLAARLAILRSQLAGRERERQLDLALQAVTALPADVLNMLLVSGLSVVDGAGTARPARQVLLSDAFWKSTPVGAAAPALDAGARSDLHAWLYRLCKLVALVRAGGGNTDWLRLVTQLRLPGAASSGLDWARIIAPQQAPGGATWTPAWAAWVACVDLRALLDPASVGMAPLTQHLDAMAAGAGAVTDAELQALCSRLAVSAPELRALAVLCAGTVSRASLSQAGVLRRLVTLAQLLRSVGCTAAQATRVLAGHANEEAAQVVRTLAQARGGSEATLNQIADSLRMQQRDALVALLLQARGWQGTDNILGHCLVDPMVQPCLRTTATLQAVAAVQLFVQRLLYGLEPGLSDVTELRRRWSWMRNYRVWEANRKVFLFPENLLFPELRDDKSPGFQMLESALGQGELNDERARQAFAAFLDDVVQMGQVQVLGLFDDSGRDSATPQVPARRTLYLVGRTTNPPYLYYWRRCDAFGSAGMEWSAWRRIELEIQGDHVMPYVWRGALYVAWPVLTERQSSSDWQLSFQWSRLDGSGWRRAESARVARDLAPVAFRNLESAFTFRCLIGTDRVRFACYAWPVPQNALAGDPGQAATTTGAGPLSSAVRDAFNGCCMAGGWQYFGQVVVGLDEAPGGYKVLASSPHSSNDMDAVHVVSWECWIKASDSGGTGYVRIDSDPGGTASPRFLLQLSVGGSPAFARQIGGSLGFWVVQYPPNRFSVPEVDCHAEYLAGAASARSATQTLASVANGEFRYTRLRMVIEPRAGQEPTLQALGIPVSAARLIPAAAFAVPEFGQGYWDDASALPLPEFHPGTSGLFNGMQGGAAHSWPLVLPTNPPGFGAVAAAAGATGEPTSRNYWLLPVSDQPDALHGSTAWLYREGANASVLDAQRAPGGLQVSAYAASFPEAGAIRRAWQQTQSLDAAQTLPITCGAAALPVPVNTANPRLWQSQLDGAFAFDLRAPCACYSWEIFFHAPLLIADALSKQQRFEEADRWLRLVFDPTGGSGSGDPRRFLRFRVFRALDPRNNVSRQLSLLARVAAGASDADVEDTTQLIGRWRELPFRPFVVARRRQIAFLWRTVFACIDNLLAWADSLYRRDTRESNAEATLLYVLVSRILGPRPKPRDSGVRRPERNYDSVQDRWDDFGNLWIDATRQHNPPAGMSPQTPGPTGIPGAEGMLLFCLPHNDKTDSYRNTVEARLFNLRHCRNIDGISRQQPLTDPPVDPALLVRASAAGLDIGQVIAGLYAPPPHYRFAVLVARATELASATRALGGALLAAMERRDAEQLSQLRSANELVMLGRVEALHQLQVAEAEAHIAALQSSRALTGARYQQYQRALGREAGAVPPAGATASDESMLGRLQSGASAASALGLLEQEGRHIEYLSNAWEWSVAAGVVKGVGAATYLASGLAFATGVGAIAGQVLKSTGDGLSVTGDMFDLVARGWEHGANHEALMASHFRRRDEWAFQSNQALRELRQIDCQILANEIRIALAKKELENQQAQTEQTQALDYFLHDKFCNADLYDWMVQQLSGVHFTAYRMARELALRAQAAAARELGGPAPAQIGNAHWDGLRAGLLAGERLYQEVKRLEVAFLDSNVRLHEITRHVSLRRLDPLGLTRLKLDRTCEFEIPEWLFDLDAPGHYGRRLKSVSLSLPCIAGPYAVVSCKLILLASRTRISVADVQSTAAYLPVAGDPRFEERYGASESIVTSTGQDDSGLFETSLSDDRFLPFEGAGAVSRWRIELPGAVPQFDYDSISDAILHLRYTARDGGESMRDSARGQFAVAGNAAPMAAPMAADRPRLLISSRSDFPAEWALATASASDLVLRLDRNLMPYWMLKAGLQFTELATLDLDGTPQRAPTLRWRRSGAPPRPAGFFFNSGDGSLSASLGSVASGVADRLLFLTLAP